MSRVKTPCCLELVRIVNTHYDDSCEGNAVTSGYSGKRLGFLCFGVCAHSADHADPSFSWLLQMNMDPPKAIIFRHISFWGDPPRLFLRVCQTSRPTRGRSVAPSKSKLCGLASDIAPLGHGLNWEVGLGSCLPFGTACHRPRGGKPSGLC